LTPRKRSRPRPVYFETTIPVLRQCRSCGAWLAAGVSEGVKAEIELGTILDLSQKLWCTVNHIEMYAMRRSGLIQMDPGRLSDPRFMTLFPQHYCHVKWPQTVLPAVPRISTSTTIPF
jgi:hypothetical protein